MNDLAQFYTKDKISKLLLSKILVENPNKILELGVGNGSLFREAKIKWKNSEIIGADIDKFNILNLRKEFPKTKFYVINGLSSNLNSKLKIELGSIDVAICNPPYLSIKKNDEFAQILKKSKLGNIEEYYQITSDLIFLAQNLLLLKENGELGIIVPDGLLTNHYFNIFRKNLIENYLLKGVIELPDKIFSKTEAKTHILIIKKTSENYNTVPLYLSDFNGDIVQKINIKKKLLIKRMDYNFHIWDYLKINNGATLLDLGVQIVRGSKSKKELSISKEKFIHTSDLNQNFISKKFAKIKQIETVNKYAETGDILISRVGKRCLGKMLYVESGRILFSDCVYRLRVPEIYRTQVISSLISQEGQKWIKAYAHGVCAKVISKSDLLMFKIKL